MNCILFLLCILVISEIGILGRNYCELSGRVEPLIADVILGFTEMGNMFRLLKLNLIETVMTFTGFNFSSLEHYVKSGKHAMLASLQPQQPQKQLNMLSAGTKEPLPGYIPKHLPPFPDPHAYVRTPVSIL